jgi:hypothetical protein
LSRALAALLLAAGCEASPLAIVDHGVPDLAAPDAALDLEVAADLQSLDADAGPICGGGYNALDPASCPLACDPAVRAVPDEGRTHVPFGTPIAYQANPPASGNHWPYPAPWGLHYEVVPREWWVHNLEHQGVVLLFNCPGDGGEPPPDGAAPDDCPEIIVALNILYGEQPPDDFYDLITETRILITPDPKLPGRVGAVAWDWSYVSDHLDMAALRCFIHARYGRGPEYAP